VPRHRDSAALPALLRIITVNERVIAPDGRERLVTAVELWADHAVVRWCESSLQPESNPLRPRDRHDRVTRPVVSVDDDLGTEYRVGRGGTSSGSWPADFHLIATPKIPTGATELRVDWGDGSRTTVPLPRGS